MDSFLKPTKCCCCIPLRAGVIIITIFWLFEAIVGIVNYITIIRDESQYNSIVAITILLDICGIIAFVLFYNHDVLAWIVSTLVDIIIAIHFALVISAYAAGENSKGDHSTNKGSGV
ncbi:hypothetical protein C2G38_2026499 [Gigaspora rosea]|uniref:Uncharacterized protein n=1 Tax=Gigaspora rosea TaxID=44941 RepID=A0A397WCW7_9GLOM|nr:hypothetical protein C2G38_2026499 [Gigaspora rosea]